MLAEPGLAVEHWPAGRADHQGDEWEDRRRHKQAEAGDSEVEPSLRQPRIGTLVQVEDAHEPRVGHASDRKTAECVLVELRQPDDTEAELGCVRQPAEDLRSAAVGGDHDKIGKRLLDDRLELVDAAEHRGAGDGVGRDHLVDDPDDAVRAIGIGRQHLEQLERGRPAADHENLGPQVDEPDFRRIEAVEERKGQNRHREELEPARNAWHEPERRGARERETGARRRMAPPTRPAATRTVRSECSTAWMPTAQAAASRIAFQAADNDTPWKPTAIPAAHATTPSVRIRPS